MQYDWQPCTPATSWWDSQEIDFYCKYPNWFPTNIAVDLLDEFISLGSGWILFVWYKTKLIYGNCSTGVS